MAQPPVFQFDQYFWCHQGNEHIRDWIAADHIQHPYIYITYINDANMVIHRKRDGKYGAHDKRMLKFLETYPMTYTDILDELIWYQANVLQLVSDVGPHYSGLIDVHPDGNTPEAAGKARDLLYKHVFDIEARHKHWVQRGEQGLLNPNEIEPFSKEQKKQQKYDEYRSRKAREAAASTTNTDTTIDPAFWADAYGENSAEYAGRLLLDLEVKKGGGNQRDAGEDEEMEG
ncbi:hypothetical protein D6D10_04663 [Aureobasidium pullulans]|uniref:Uncharacterized protein n=1 Tax=Aureobasidium pullulans TaxID=5580 RepID=A0A4S9EWB3_AURPU|nr:hypothetical protein D6D10_04663 [Aureobasidium pullulans]